MNNPLKLMYALICSVAVSTNNCAVLTQHDEGFIAGTHVKIPQGYAAIEALREGDRVISYNHKDHSLQEDVIRRIHRQDCDRVVEIIVDGVEVQAGYNQKFYRRSGSNEQWVAAHDLKANDVVLMGDRRWGRVDQVSFTKQRVAIYDLSTAKYHNFFVSSHNILTHNIVFVVGAIAAFDLVVEIAAPAIAFGAICLYCKLTGKKLFCPFTIQPPNDNDWHHMLKNNRHDHGFDGKDPKKIWDHAQMILMAAMSRDEIRDNALYRISGATEYGVMEIKGIVIDGVVRISTMYMKGNQ